MSGSSATFSFPGSDFCRRWVKKFAHKGTVKINIANVQAKKLGRVETSTFEPNALWDAAIFYTGIQDMVIPLPLSGSISLGRPTKSYSFLIFDSKGKLLSVSKDIEFDFPKQLGKNFVDSQGDLHFVYVATKFGASSQGKHLAHYGVRLPKLDEKSLRFVVETLKHFHGPLGFHEGYDSIILFTRRLNEKESIELRRLHEDAVAAVHFAMDHFSPGMKVEIFRQLKPFLWVEIPLHREQDLILEDSSLPEGGELKAMTSIDQIGKGRVVYYQTSSDEYVMVWVEKSSDGKYKFQYLQDSKQYKAGHRVTSTAEKLKEFLPRFFIPSEAVELSQ